MPLPRYARLLTLLLAAIQLAAPAFVSVADGAYSKQVRDAGMHIESLGGNECTPPHAADCTVCRYLSNGTADSTEKASEPLPAEATSRSIAAVQLREAIDRAPTQSRAPPSV